MIGCADVTSVNGNIITALLFQEITDILYFCVENPEFDNTDSLLSSVYTLLMLIYDRDSRRRFCPDNHWLIK